MKKLWHETSDFLSKTPHMFAPFIPWLKHYNRHKLHADFIAGLTVAVILIPQAMAYSMVAGLPPVYGLYAALFGAAIASLWGSSRQLATGPVALVSFLTLATLLPLAPPGSAEFIALAIALALVVGIVQLLMGIFRLGFIMHFIPHSVLIGFSSAAAIIIALTQVPQLFGFAVNAHDHVFETVIEIGLNLYQVHFPTLAIGVIALLAIFLLKRISAAFPAALLIIVVSTTLSFFVGFQEMGIEIVGTIPSSIPTPSLPAVSLLTFGSLLGKGIIISLIGFLEAYAISRTIATKTKQKLNINQELVGQGLANIASGLFRGYPISGSFSRTAVNSAAGAQTGMSGVFVSGFVLLTLVFLTPLLYYLPRVILAAIVIQAVWQLVDFRRYKQIYAISKTETYIAVGVFCLAFLFKPDDAVLIGVIVALVLFLRRTVWARVVEVGVERDLQVLHAVDVSQNIQTYPHVLMVRIDMHFYYANSNHVIEEIEKHIRKHVKEHKQPLESLVIDFSGVNYIDLTGLELLGEFIKELNEKAIVVHGIYVKLSVRKALERAHVADRIHFLGNIADLKKRCKCKDEELETYGKKK